MLNLLAAGIELIRRVIPDKEKQLEAQQRLLELEQRGELSLIEQQAKVITAESSGESWLQRNWRPLTMLVFVGLVVAKWLGYTAPGITEALELKLMTIIEIGLGGYVVGRSVEKAIKTWKEK